MAYIYEFEEFLRKGYIWLSAHGVHAVSDSGAVRVGGAIPQLCIAALGLDFTQPLLVLSDHRISDSLVFVRKFCLGSI